PTLREYLGAVLYRAGKYPEAIVELAKVARPVNDDPATPQTSAAYVCYFLALAHARLRHADEAAHWLAQAAGWTDKELNPPASPTTNHRPAVPRAVAWNRRDTLNLLRAEAEAEITNNAYLWIARGRAPAERGESEKADAEFAKAAALTANELDKFLEAG